MIFRYVYVHLYFTVNAEFIFKRCPYGGRVSKPLPGETCTLNIVPGQSGNDELQVSRFNLLHHFSNLTYVDVRQGVLFPQKLQRERVVCRMDHYPAS